MLVDRARPNLYMQYARDAIYNINDIKEALHPNTRNHLLAAHAISGCGTVSALFKVGKKKALQVGGGAVVSVRALEPRVPVSNPRYPLTTFQYLISPPVAKDYPNCCHTVLRRDLQR